MATAIFTDMTTKGPQGRQISVSAEIQKRAFAQWAKKRTELRYSSLGVHIDAVMENAWGQHPHQFSRAADRIMQKLRKAGFIAWNGRSWSLTDDGEKMRLKIVHQENS